MANKLSGGSPAAVVRLTRTIKTTTQTDDALQIAIWHSVSTVISSLAWPIAIALIVFLLKSELVALLGRVRTLKALGVEASLDAQIKENLSAVPEAPINEPLHEDASAKTLSQFNSSEAILEAWASVEDALGTLAPTGHDVRLSSVRTKIQGLLTDKNAPTGLAYTVLELCRIRDRLARNSGEFISDASVRLYKQNARLAVQQIQALLE